MFPMRLLDGLGRDGQRYWRTQHGPIIRSHAAAAGIAATSRCTYTPRPRSLAPESRGTQTPAYDGHAEVWLDRGHLPSSPEARGRVTEPSRMKASLSTSSAPPCGSERSSFLRPPRMELGGHQQTSAHQDLRPGRLSGKKILITGGASGLGLAWQNASPKKAQTFTLPI